MARNERDTRKSGGVEVADAAPAEAQPESLDKVRDILFGSQMRTVESRLQGLEERLRSEHEALRADFARQIESLDATLRSEAMALKEALRALEKRHGKLEEDTSMADAGLRDQLLLQATAAAAELTRLGERLTAELNRSHQELKSTKTDSAALAGLLSELAARVGGAPASAATPGKSAPGG